MRRFWLLAMVAVALRVDARPAVPDWVLLASKIATPAYASGSKAVVLFDEDEVTISPDGTFTTRSRRVIRVLGHGAEQLTTVAAFSDWQQQLVSLNAWSESDSGSWRFFTQRDAIETASFAGWELYTDTRAKFLRLPAVPGTVGAWELVWSGRPPSWQVAWPFQSELPVVRSTLTLQVPHMAVVDAEWSRHEAVAPAREGDRYTWEMTDVHGIPGEEQMPAPEVVGARVDINVKRSAESPSPTWKSIGQWYAGLSAESVSRTSSQLQLTARQLTQGAGDFWSKVRALARFAQHDVRYVAVEIGIGGYKPHPAAEIFSNRFGDCKDKVTVLRAMLREAGIDSRYVIVNATPGVVGDFPSIHSFNHVIAAIRVPDGVDTSRSDAVIDHGSEGKLVIFDPTSPITPVGGLPLYLRGSRGLLVTANGGDLITLPAGSPSLSQVHRAAKFAIDDGKLTGIVEEVRSGLRADLVREFLQSLQGNARVRYVEDLVRPSRPDVTVSGVTIDGVDDPYKPLRISYRISDNSALMNVGGMLLLRAWPLRYDEEAIIDAKGRTLPYVTQGPGTNTDSIEVALPPTLAVDQLPKAASISGPAIRYTTSYHQEANILHAQREYEVGALSIEPPSTPAFMSALGRIRAEERNNIVLKER
jgi:transglutaminase-like putative cysteine protease